MVKLHSSGMVTRISLAYAVMVLATLAQAAPNRYATQVLADGPIGYWRLGESPGATAAADSSGHGNNGTYSATGITLGQPGFHDGDTAALFDGRSGRIVVPNSASLNPRNISMEAKVGWAGSNQFQQRILEKSFFVDPGQEQAQYGLSILDSGQVRVELRTGLGNSTDPVCNSRNVVCANSNTQVARTVESYIVATYDGSTIKIYINGALDSQTSAGDRAGDIEPVLPDPTKPSDLGIGNQSIRNRPFNGVIDELAIYDRVLTADQVQAHYQSQLGESTGSFQYAAKFVCVTNILGTSASTTTVLPGAYATVVNIHNPNSESVSLRVKIAVPGKVSDFFKDKYKLGPDGMIQVDCTQILRDFGIRFIHGAEGFLVIESPLSLDVVAVYTAGKRAPDDAVQSIAVERVHERKIP